jgi:hypothetical protein
MEHTNIKFEQKTEEYDLFLIPKNTAAICIFMAILLVLYIIL